MTLTAHDIIKGKRPRLRDLLDVDLDLPQATLTKDSTVRDAMRIMSEENRGAVVVQDEADALISIVSERDIVNSISATGAEVLEWTVDRIMTRLVVTADEDTSCHTTLTQMIDKRFRNMPVYSADGKFVGCVDILQVAHAKVAELTESNRKLMDLLALLNNTRVTVRPNVCSATIKDMFHTDGVECIIVREDGKNLGFITQDEFLRALHRASGENAS